MINMNSLTVLKLLSVEKSMRDIAEKMNMSISSISKYIADLERALGGVKLVKRGKKESTLTEAGNLVFFELCSILSYMEKSEQKLIKILAEYRRRKLDEKSAK